MKSTQNQLAKDLYFGTHKSRKEIADEVGITTKTLYLWIKKGAWDELRSASLAAPAIMVDNFCHMVVELQMEIAHRPIFNRSPSQQEMETLRKLVNCITKLKQYASTGMNMQVMADFVKYVDPDEEFKQKLQLYAEGYFKARKANERYPNEFEFGHPAPMTNEEEIEAIKQEIEARFGPHQVEEKTTEGTTPNITTEQEIPNNGVAETRTEHDLQPVKNIEPKFPQPEKTGRSTRFFVIPGLTRNLPRPVLQPKRMFPSHLVLGICQKAPSTLHSIDPPPAP